MRGRDVHKGHFHQADAVGRVFGLKVSGEGGKVIALAGEDADAVVQKNAGVVFPAAEVGELVAAYGQPQAGIRVLGLQGFESADCVVGFPEAEFYIGDLDFSVEFGVS